MNESLSSMIVPGVLWALVLFSVMCPVLNKVYTF